MTDSQSPAIERRTELLTAARSLFEERGFGRTPVSAIVQRAGVSQGTFYLYFPGKQQLLAELRREVFGRYAATLARLAAAPGPADERLARVVISMAEVVAAQLPLERMFRQAESGEESLAAVRDGRSRLATLALRFLDQGIEDGSLRADSPALFAHFVVTLFDEVLFETLAYAPEALPEVLAASLSFVLGALRVPPDRVAALLLLIPRRSP